MRWKNFDVSLKKMIECLKHFSVISVVKCFHQIVLLCMDNTLIYILDGVSELTSISLRRILSPFPLCPPPYPASNLNVLVEPRISWPSGPRTRFAWGRTCLSIQM